MKQKISKSNSFEGFNLKTFLLGFKKPAIVLITMGITYVAANPTGSELITYLGGSAIVIERLWALVEFYIKQIKLK